MNPIHLAKLYKRLNEMFLNESDDFFSNIALKKEVEDMILDYQHLHLYNLICAFTYNNILLDGSDTGTGKTYTTVALCKQLGLKPFIICPKSIISNWRTICKKFSVDPICVVNYETIRSGKIYDTEGKRIDCPYLNIDKNMKTERRFRWNGLPRNAIFIFDEVHKCKSKTTLNGKLLMSCKELKRIKMLLLSATICDKPESFSIFGYILGLYKNIKQGKNWINDLLKVQKQSLSQKNPISSEIYPYYGSRMSINEIDSFPENQISADCYSGIKDSNLEVNKQLKFVETNKSNDNQLIITKVIHSRQKLELMKLPIFIDLATDYLENGYSVAVFFNFNKTLDKFMEKMKTKCCIRGDQKIEERDKHIDDFQLNREHIIACNIKAGGQGVSLHDVNGRPRVSLISPTFSSIDMKQALGRIYRSGSLSPALQRIIYCAGTVEEIVCAKVGEKLKFMNQLTDDDLCL